MPNGQQLPIVGYRGETVPNRFVRQKGEADRLAVFLPGLAYTCDMPLFYYATNLLTDAGWDLLRVDYAYHRRADYRNLAEAERLRWLLADATATWRSSASRWGRWRWATC